MKVYSQLEIAQWENLTANPSLLPPGRFWFRTDLVKAKITDGANIRDFLLNDDKLIIGTSGTAGTNTRIYRAGTGLLAFVDGAEATAEGSAPVALDMLAFRHEVYTDAGKPSFGQQGRIIYNSDLSTVQIDTGAAWATLSTSGNVAGPASSTDSGFAKFDGTTGKLLKNSAATIAYAQLVLTTSIVDGDISASAAISLSKIAGGTTSRIPFASSATAMTNSAELTFASNVLAIGKGTPATGGGLQIVASAGGQAIGIFGRASDDFAWAPLTRNNADSAYMGGFSWTPGGVSLLLGAALTNVFSIPSSTNVLALAQPLPITSGGTGQTSLTTGGTGGSGSPAIVSGTYSPTNVGSNTNISALGFSTACWCRVGNVVTVSGSVNITPTAATTFTEFSISLPVASSFSGSASNGFGTAVSRTATADINPYAISNSATASHMTFAGVASHTGLKGYSYIFSYPVI